MRHLPLILAVLSSTALATPFKTPLPASAMPAAAMVFSHQLPAAAAPADHGAAAAALAAGTLTTLPYWQSAFSLGARSYNVTTLGTPPTSGQSTTIPAVLVPFRLVIEDTSVDGQHPLVLDGARIAIEAAQSPIFQTASYGALSGQFADAMLHADYPDAAPGWHLLWSATRAPTVTVHILPGHDTVYQSRTGAYYAILTGGEVYRAMDVWAKAHPNPHQTPIFLAFNALLSGAYGFHSYFYDPLRNAALIYSFNSWIDRVPELQSPDVSTVSHEVAEIVQDPLGPGGTASKTRYWGDAFRDNRCFQNYIEVGDAVEDAPYPVWSYKVASGAQHHLYTLQTVALLPWFERQTPSTALGGAYSFPGPALTSAAPYACNRS